MSKRQCALIVLCAVLFTTASFAATKKSERDRDRSSWSDLSLQNGDLPGDLSLQVGNLSSAGRSASGGVGSDHMSGGGPLGPPLGNPGTPDNWGGGTGSWSTGSWSSGLPGAGSDVTINTGSDYVTLDVNASINSLVLGGVGSSVLTDAGVAQTLTIANDLTVGASGQLYFTGGTTVTVGGNASNAYYIQLFNGSTLSITGNFDNNYVAEAVNGASVINVGGTLTNEASGQFYEQGGAASIGKLVNNGYFVIGAGASVNLTAQPGGITDVVAGSRYDISGSFTAGANSAFVNLTGIEGQVYLYGQNVSITPNGGTLTTSGYLSAASGSSLTITGDVSNSGFLSTGYYGTGGNTLNISGTLTNNSQFYVYGNLDVATVGTLVNNSLVYVGTGATLNVGNTITDVAAGSTYEIYGTFKTAGMTAFTGLNSNEGTIYLTNGQTANITPGTGTLANSGNFAIGGGSTVNITGNVTNNSYLTTGYITSGTNDILNISGTLTNNSQFYVNGNLDVATVGTLVNNGALSVQTGATLNIGNSITDAVAGSTYSIYGTFNSGGISAFTGLNSNEGTIDLANGQTTNITPGSGTLANTGTFAVGNGSTVNIIGDVTNSGYLTTYYFIGGTNDKLNISGTLTNNNQFYVYGNGDVANVGTLVNNGRLIVNTGATLNLTTQLNVTDVPVGSDYEIYGTFNAGPNNAFSTLSSIEGEVLLGGQTTTITPGGGTLTNTGTFGIGAATTLTINGDVVNSGFLSTSYYVGGSSSTLDISGTLTNKSGALFYLYGNGDIANVGAFSNNGTLYIGTGATLNLTTQLSVNDVPAGADYTILGTFNAGPNNAFTNLTSIEGAVLLANGQTTDITPNGGLMTIASGGQLSDGNNSTINIHGDVSNSGYINTGANYGNSTGAHLTIDGTLTNNSGGQFYLYDPGDVANVGTLVNNGTLYIGTGATLNLTTQLSVNDVPAGADYTILGTFNAGPNNAFATLTTIEGAVILANGQTTDITPNGGVMTLASGGQLSEGADSTITIHGDLNTSGYLNTGANYGNSTGGHLNITGNLTNNGSGQFYMYDTNDMTTVGGSLTNSGVVSLSGYNQTLAVGGDMTNAAGGTVDVYYTGTTLQVGGTLTNLGVINVLAGAAVDPPTLNNGGTINIDATSKLVVGTGAAGLGYTQLANGTLGEIIASGSSYGIINVAGMAALDGTLKILLQAGYDPTIGTTFKFLNSSTGQIAGTFANVLNLYFNGGTEMWAVSYDPSGNFVALTAEAAVGGIDYWLGGKDVWSNGGQWSLGVPSPIDDVAIYSQTTNDVVTMDFGSTTIKSLMLGGASNGYTNELTDGGTAQTLTITNALTVGTTGTLYLWGGSTVTAGADSSNAGLIALENASKLTVNGNLDNAGTIQTGATLGGGNNFTVSGNFNNSGSFSLNGALDLANVGSITNTGAVYIGYGTQLNLQSQPGGVTDVGAGSSWQIYGSFTENSSNFGFENLSGIEGTIDLENVQSSAINPGGIGGTLTISNTGALDVGNKTALTINGNVDNAGFLSTGRYNVGGNTLTINGNLTNEGGGTFALYNGIPPNGVGDLATINGTLTNSGYVDVEGGSTLHVTSDATNYGYIYTGTNTTGNKLNIDGTLTNQGVLILYGKGDVTTIGTNLITSNFADVEGGATLQVNGNATNSDILATSWYGGHGNTLTINGNLTNNGTFYLNGSGDVANVSTLTNNNYTYVGAGATLNLTNQSGGITSTTAGSRFDLLGSFNDVLGAANGFANLTTNGGTVIIANGQATGITPTGGTFTNTGLLDVSGSTVQINGNVNNAAEIYTGNDYTGNPSTLTITGNLSNFLLNMYNAGDTVNVNGNLDNIAQINFNNANQTLTVGGLLTNEATGEISVAGAGSLLAAPGGLTNLGTISVSGGATIDPPTLNNGGTITIDGTSKLVVGTGLNPGQGYTHFANGTLGEIITGANSFGVINVTGNATLMNGTLEVLLQAGYDPINGTGFKFLNYTGSLTGGFNPNIVNDIFNGGAQMWVLSYGAGYVELTAEAVSTGTDSWLGGTGNWSSTNWSTGNPPTPTQDTVIYSDITNDLVTMDFGTTTIASLTLGGSDTTYSSELTDGGVKQTLNITNDLTVGQSGYLYLWGGSTINTGDPTNAGIIELDNGSTLAITGNLTNTSTGTVNLENASVLSVTGDVNNSGTIQTNFALLGGNNTITIGGMLTNSGTFQLNGPMDLATIGNGVTNNAGGFIEVNGGSTLNITGDVTNAGNFQTGGSGSGNMVNITGTLNNQGGGNFILFGTGDVATMNGLVNSGNFVGAENGSTIQVNGDADNFGLLYTGFVGTGTLNVTGTLTNEAIGAFILYGPVDPGPAGGTTTLGALINYGIAEVENGSTLTSGTVDNFGTLITGFYGNGGNTLSVTGSFTNEMGGQFTLYGQPGGPADMATLGSLNNAGTVNVDNGSTLDVTHDVTNSGDIFTDPGSNKINIGGNLNNTGTFQLNGPGDMAALGSLTNNVGGFVDVEGGSTLTISGDVINNAGGVNHGIYTSIYGTGGNTLTIGGTLTNSGAFELLGAGDMGMIGSGMGTALTNNAAGYLNVEGGSTLTVNGDADNSGELETSGNGGTGGSKLTINGMLTNEAGGLFQLNGPGDKATIGGSVNNSGNFYVYNSSMATIGNGMGTALANSGYVDVEGGSTLNITGDVTNNGLIITDASHGPGGNKLTITGNLIDNFEVGFLGLGDQGTITGDVMNNGGALFIADRGATGNIGGNLINAGLVDADKGGTLNIGGNVTNSGTLITDNYGLGGGNTINVTGMLTNEAGGTFTLGGPVDMATLGSLNNAGTVNVDNGSTLTITGNATNSGDIFTDPGGNKINIGGMLTNGGTFQLDGPGDMATIGNGMSNTGIVDVEGASTLAITGDVLNNGSILTNFHNFGGGNNITVSGMLTNNGVFALSGPGDKSIIGSLTNNAGAFVDVENGSTLNITGDVSNSAGGMGFGIYTSFNGTGGNTITVGGLLTNNATGQINLNGPGDVLQALAGLSNNGVINVNGGSSIDPPFVNNGGTINIGAGSKMIVGTGMPMGTGYIQLGNGTLGEMINGYGNGNFGVINVNGSALLAGTLDIILKAGFNPMAGTEYTILTSSPGLLSGTFGGGIMNDCFNGGTECWVPTYDYADGLLELTATPNGPPPVSEPATLAVLIPGLLGMGYGLRRRLSK